MYTYIVNNKVFKSYKVADKYAVELRNNGKSVCCRVECGNIPVKRYSQKMRVKNSRDTWNKKEFASTDYGNELEYQRIKYEEQYIEWRRITVESAYYVREVE